MMSCMIIVWSSLESRAENMHQKESRGTVMMLCLMLLCELCDA